MCKLEREAPFGPVWHGSYLLALVSLNPTVVKGLRQGILYAHAGPLRRYSYETLAAWPL